MRLIPVALQFEDIAPDSWARITILTPQVGWSIGDASRDSLGLSCNGKDLLRVREARFQCLEIVGPSLSLKTPPNSGAASFAFTLFVTAPDDVDLLEAHCEINDGASVLAEFGNLRRQTWMPGRVSAMVPPVLHDIRRVTLFIRGVRLGERVRISLRAESRMKSMYWCLGPNVTQYGLNPEIAQMLWGSAVRTEDELPLPLRRLSLGATEIEMELAGSDEAVGGDGPDVLIVEANVLCISSDRSDAADQLGRVLLKVDCNDDVSVIAQCGYRQPQYLTPAVYKPFEF